MTRIDNYIPHESTNVITYPRLELISVSKWVPDSEKESQ